MLKQVVRGGVLVAAAGIGLKVFDGRKSDDDSIEDYIKRNYKSDDGPLPTPSISYVRKTDIDEAIKSSEAVLRTCMIMKQIPGLVVGVSHNGSEVWTRGLGYANIEQLSPIHRESVMRIASISKSITMLVVAKLVEDGKLDLDKPINEYLDASKWPVKTWNGKEVKITLRQLVAHLGGIRHYKKTLKELAEEGHKNSDPKSWLPSLSTSSDQKKSSLTSCDDNEFDEKFLKTRFKDVYESLNLFKDDNLIHEPGTKYEYTTFGWTLISAVVQSVLPDGKDFGNYLVKDILHDQLGMTNTFLDEPEPIIRNRVNYYLEAASRPKVSRSAPKSVILNAPYVDSSYKWAGGGLLSTIPDLLKFGNVMMYSFLGYDPKTGLKGYLNEKTVEEMWTPNELTQRGQFWSYGMGWQIIRAEDLKKLKTSDGKELCAGAVSPPFEGAIAYHSGAAIGASSALLILPRQKLVVAMFCNMQGVSLAEAAIQVAKYFDTALN